MKKSFFTPEELTKFKKLYPVTMTPVLCKMFCLSESQLRSRAKYYGVRKTAELIKQAQSLARTGKKHSHHRRQQPAEETLDPETDGLCINTAHGIKEITQHACGTTTVHRMR
ncbi:MAG: hypothetical protein ABTS22_11485 [Accumulibacter sp.]|uniref:hypothetical protein n=1 Tax=Accumulibacter sp. TaxID=2053492 RepID=UPI003314667F